MRESFVDELRGEHRGRLFDRIRGREIVVLARIDDDAAAGVEHPREVLVDERTLHVDVAEQDTVHRVVEQHVEPLEGRHRRDLGHAQAARIIGEHHAVRHEVEQRLTGRADDRNDLRAGFGRCDGGGPVLVDVAAGDDHVEQRRRRLRQPLEQRGPLFATRVEPSERAHDGLRERAARGRVRCQIGRV